MCTTCGCGDAETRIDGDPTGAHEHEHAHADGTAHAHPHAHGGEHTHVHTGVHPAGVPGHADPGLTWHRHGEGAWHSHVHGGGSPHEHGGAPASGAFGAVHAAGMSPARTVQIEQDILAKNNASAAENRRIFAERGMFVLNLVSSPGSGKTSLLVRTIDALQGRLPVAVIEGDQQTSRDADRVRATGAPAVQINTGKGCHLDAQMVGRALPRLDLADGTLLMIENVGNLVCPAAFDLGEEHKVVILSVTEGEDKPLKYPDMFHAADLLLINKVDLLPYVEFDMDAAIAYARRVRPDLPVLRVSATTGEGFGDWLAWLLQGAATARAARDRSVAALRSRIAELEAELARRAGGAAAG